MGCGNCWTVWFCSFSSLIVISSVWFICVCLCVHTSYHVYIFFIATGFRNTCLSLFSSSNEATFIWQVFWSLQHFYIMIICLKLTPSRCKPTKGSIYPLLVFMRAITRDNVNTQLEHQKLYFNFLIYFSTISSPMQVISLTYFCLHICGNYPSSSSCQRQTGSLWLVQSGYDNTLKTVFSKVHRNSCGTARFKQHSVNQFGLHVMDVHLCVNVLAVLQLQFSEEDSNSLKLQCRN